MINHILCAEMIIQVDYAHIVRKIFLIKPSTTRNMEDAWPSEPSFTICQYEEILKSIKNLIILLFLYSVKKLLSNIIYGTQVLKS